MKDEVAGQPVAVIEIIKDTTEYDAAAAGAQRSLVLGTGAILLTAVLLALVLGRSLSRPLTAITAPMPGSERRDEIGTMAQALLVFRRNVQEARDLQGEADRVRAAKDRRQEAMDQHTLDFGTSTSGVMDSLERSAQLVRRTAEVAGMAAAADRVGTVVRLINDIARKTNLLALNATIEAAAPARPAAASPWWPAR